MRTFLVTAGHGNNNTELTFMKGVCEAMQILETKVGQFFLRHPVDKQTYIDFNAQGNTSLKSNGEKAKAVEL